MTILLALFHAFTRNSSFRPELLYVGTFIIDISLIKGLL